MRTARSSPSLLPHLLLLLAAAPLLLASCGGDSGSSKESASQASASSYLAGMPTWDNYSPPVKVPPQKVGETTSADETIDDIPVKDPVDNSLLGYRSEQYACTSTRFSMEDTPERIVMFSPDRELLWPGALIQGRSHRDGIGSLKGLTIRERAPIKVSIPSLANEDNFRQVAEPDLANVNQAIGSMISNATTDNLVTPSTIQFFMEDYSSEESFALNMKLSGKYMGFRASASSSISRNANERTVMVFFYEKMFEVVVAPPQTPGLFFSDAFTPEKLDEQVRLGNIGPGNPPVYVSNIVYGRMMAFTFTSTATSSEIKAALSAAYNGIFSVSGSVDASHRKVLSEGKISVTSIGGQAKATEAMIASGDWRQYFTASAPLTSASPISYTFRNLRDGSIAKVSEGTEYTIKECTLKDASFTGFVLDSFENGLDNWTAMAPPLTLSLGEPDTPQSIFYGYAKAEHNNAPTPGSNAFMYSVGYLLGPDHFKGDKQDFYKGELSFWFKPDEYLHSTPFSYTYCWTEWILWIPIPRCATKTYNILPSQPLEPTDKVFAFDNVTTFDHVLLRGGIEPYGVLTLTYNPPAREIGQGWSRFEVSLTNDNAASSPCDRLHPLAGGCWLNENVAASEEEIKYVLSNITDFRIRSSYPMYKRIDSANLPVGDDNVVIAPPDAVRLDDEYFLPHGYVGGYFDEIKMNKKSAGL